MKPIISVLTKRGVPIAVAVVAAVALFAAAMDARRRRRQRQRLSIARLAPEGPIFSPHYVQSAASGDWIFSRVWRPAVGRPKCVVVISHGYAEHSGRYEHVADRLCREDVGAAVIGVDHRGHGRSEGERVMISDVAEYAADLIAAAAMQCRRNGCERLVAQRTMRIEPGRGGAGRGGASVGQGKRGTGLRLPLTCTGFDRVDPQGTAFRASSWGTRWADSSRCMPCLRTRRHGAVSF